MSLHTRAVVPKILITKCVFNHFNLSLNGCKYKNKQSLYSKIKFISIFEFTTLFKQINSHPFM